jgi:hypothetical protein
MVPVARGARGAGASLPRASPDTVPKPAAPRSCASRSANLTPAVEALREPTMATSGRVSTASLPRTASKGGASSIIYRRGG